MKRAIAEAVIDRDQGRCQFPVRRQKCGSSRTQLHHRRIRSQGGKDDPDNLILLCQRHHNHVHAHPTESRKSGLIVFDGDPTDRKPWMDDRLPEEDSQ